MARNLRMADWSGDDETVLTKSPWWKKEGRDTLPDLTVPDSHIRELIRSPGHAAEEEPTSVMTAASRTELLQACRHPDTRWMVRNGSRKVGPVSTALVIAGILARRVPAGCEVLCLGTSSWQPLPDIAPFSEALAKLEGGSSE